jgi:hypothetical protein
MGVFRGTRNRAVVNPGAALAGRSARTIRPNCSISPVACAWIWRPFNNGMPQGALVTKLRANPAENSLYAATYGRGAFTTAPEPVIFRGTRRGKGRAGAAR